MANTSSGSPVLQVFMNDDLLFIIFGFLKIERQVPCERDGPSLVACALVCRAFHDPALGVIWREMSTTGPLWDLLAPPGRSAYYRSNDGRRHTGTYSKRQECIHSVSHSGYPILSINAESWPCTDNLSEALRRPGDIQSVSLVRVPYPSSLEVFCGTDPIRT